MRPARRAEGRRGRDAGGDAPDRAVEVRRIELPFALDREPDPSWLDAAPLLPRFFWRPRSNRGAIAACGSVWTGSLEDACALLEKSGPGARALGGAAFHGEGRPGEEWREFPGERFFIPRVEIVGTGSGAVVAVNEARGAPSPAKAEEWLAAIANLPRRESGPVALARWDRPNFEQWAEGVAKALEQFRRGRLEKAVLARLSRIELSFAPRPFLLLDRLSRRAPGCFHFGFQPVEQSGVFLGASPELLFRRVGERIESEALAGTRPRSLDPAEDERLEAQLRNLGKERHEHRVVVEELDRVFSRICSTHSLPKAPSVLKLPELQHLQTPFHGSRAPGISDAEILRALHPTPATCGCPARPAARFLRKNESFERGWYAGPLGTLSSQMSEFAVAIRSMRLRGNLLDLYAGAGIVAESDPEKEWEELESKIAGVLRMLTR